MSSIAKDIEQLGSDALDAVGLKDLDGASPEERQGARDKNTALHAKVKARKAIIPIADPDAGKHGKRRASARRRAKSGRMSTILSNTETLG